MLVRPALLFVLAAAIPAYSQRDGRKSVSLDLAAQAVQRVRAQYFAMDYVGGVEEADRLVKQFPKSRELAAWRAANLARSDRPRETQAAVKALLDANIADPWGWFAQTFLMEYASESSGPADVLRASLEAYRRAPANPTIQWLRAFALANSREGPHALALIDSIAKRGPLTQELTTLRATALFSAATPGLKTDQAKVDSAFALYALARASDPTDVTAHTFAASRMMNAGRNTDAYALAKRGTELSPLALTTHQNYWRAIDAMKDRSQAARDSEALADVDALVRGRPNEPTVLLAAADQFKSRRRPDQARVLEDRVLSEHPATRSAEWVLVNRYRALGRDRRDSTIHDSTLAPRYRQALWAFLERPSHTSDRLIGDAYRELFDMTDSTSNADTLLRIVRGMVKYEGINPHAVYAAGAVRLAERGRDFKEAEQIARDGVKAGRARIAEQKQIYETVGDYAQAVDWMSAFMYDALGQVYVREGRLDDGERELKRAHELDPKSINALYHLGGLAERRGRLDEAEQYYMKGALLPNFRALGTNPTRDALQRVYKAKKGSLDGYDAYFASLSETDRANRKADIAKTRAATPPALSTFSLRSLDGRVITLDSLRGKTAVINNWGMWCGPCVAEMPEYQKLATQFAADSTVRVLTIDFNDPNTDELRAWLQKKGYTFTTLLDDGFLARSGIHTYPTTWFLDPSGRVVFTKVGTSEKLVEEFGWRIDMIRKPSAMP